MTTPTPTSDLSAGGNVPAGLPDVATLARLAGQFFAALPGDPSPADLPSNAASAAPVLHVGAQPQAPDPIVSLGNRAPALVPATAEAPLAGLPSGGVAQGVPLDYAAALPAIDAPQAATGGQSYYFLESAHESLPARSGPHEDRIVARSFGLPGEDSLRVGLPVATQAPATEPDRQQWFYFTDLVTGENGRSAQAAPQGGAFDVHAVRRDFPILQERVNGKPLVWLDNAATTHKPQAVIDRLAYFYAHENSNIHRAAHELAARATDAYEGARSAVARFIGAASAEEIIFVRGATEAINLVARTWGVQNIEAGDEIIVSHLEHHANIVPWQQLAAEKGARLRVIPVDEDGQLRLDEFRKLLCSKTRLVAVTQVSNALGTVTPIAEVIGMAHAVGARVLVDGAQSVSHMRVNVRALDADFFVFSGHKIFGPTGIGVVYGKRDILEQMPPWQGGGNMIADVTFERTVYQPPPNRFEAGTGNIADAVGLGAALDYVDGIGLERIAAYEHSLLEYATRALRSIGGVRLIGTAADKASVISFVLAGYSTEEVGKALNREGVAVRTGHHCAQPILRRFGLETSVRPSLAFYNTCEEIDLLARVVRRLAGQRH
ncbi:family 2A encapsulin nanocompartment cargo protein cysteine desulfurase [Uliginosibacterium sp. sgz301328]|uniref:family 2A encapsulin nanocompartment cargo protein cysteine desulfurase n=1 Tax=Uliginosibacterium sp. sgz301328 TaxID=3243764 RepID=UPI00359CEFC3